MNGRWHGAGIEGITDPESGLQDTMGDTGLCLLFYKVTRNATMVSLERGEKQ